MENRGQHGTLAQISDAEARLPFALLGVDRDHGGEFLNHPLAAYLGQRQKPMLFTHSRPYKKDGAAHVEQRNWTPGRRHFGSERYDNPAVVPLINALCQGPQGQRLNPFLPTQQLPQKRRVGTRLVRVSGPAALAPPPVQPAQRTQLRCDHARLNPFPLAGEVERQQAVIAAQRQLAV